MVTKFCKVALRGFYAATVCYDLKRQQYNWAWLLSTTIVLETDVCRDPAVYMVRCINRFRERTRRRMHFRTRTNK